MTKEPDIALFIFRRDLRVYDNTGLYEALKTGLPVAPVFIFDPRQVKSNAYFARNAFQFLIESLEELDQKLAGLGSKLYIFEGEAEAVIERLLKSTNPHIRQLFFNKDYTPFSRARDEKLLGLSNKYGITVQGCSDSLLFEPGKVLKNDGLPYTVYTHFMKKAFQQEFRKADQKLPEGKFYSGQLQYSRPADEIFSKLLPHRSSKLISKGGRIAAAEIVKGLGSYVNYDNDRNFPAIKGTSTLAPHNKFGTVSIREIHKELLKHYHPECTLVKELLWRDFFSHIGYFFPHVYSGAFNKRYDSIKWRTDESLLKSFKSGETGFPIVDAGVRELIETGFMHNRVRMITASFLVKDLHIDWRIGEKFFAEHLTDYDPAVNNGNWQWAASTGCDAQPYFRIFNPWLQQQKFDEDCIYIKKWIPELADFKPKQIHKIAESDAKLTGRYPNPIVNHDFEKKIALEMYTNL